MLNSAYETVADYTFDAFGVQRAVNGDVYNPFRHNGEYYDEELGYTYLRNRYYDNNNGRFITEDPIKDGLNWYSYCWSNPIKYIDFLGLGANDVFDCVEDALADMFYNYYGITDYTKFELSACVYTIREINEETNEKIIHYSYTDPRIFEPEKSYPSKCIQDIPEGCFFEGYVHSHPALSVDMAEEVDGFSDLDWNFVYENADLYVLTPKGNVLLLKQDGLDEEYDYNNNQGKIILENVKFKKFTGLEKICYAMHYTPMLMEYIKQGPKNSWFTSESLLYIDMYYDYHNAEKRIRDLVGL